MSDTALLVIDAQVNMFGPEWPVHDASGIGEKLKALIDKAHAAEVPVIYIQNNGGEGDPDLPGTPGWEIYPLLKPQAGDSVVEKTTPDSFHETGLKAALEEHGVKNLVIAGMQTDWCVQTTTRRAAELGYHLTLVKDAHSTLDSSTQTAPEIIADYNRQLAEVATLKDTAEVTF